MGKKKVVLYGVTALFAVSGVVALPSGNITGGIGCVVIAAVCFLLARKPAKEAAGQQATPRATGAPAAYVKWGNKILGYLSAELAKDLAAKYPNARYTAEILEISGGGGTDVWV